MGALVFYGRRRYAKVLNMYLERNLAANGGILHEVIVLHTDSNHCCHRFTSFRHDITFRLVQSMMAKRAHVKLAKAILLQVFEAASPIMRVPSAVWASQAYPARSVPISLRLHTCCTAADRRLESPTNTRNMM